MKPLPMGHFFRIANDIVELPQIKGGNSKYTCIYPSAGMLYLKSFHNYLEKRGVLCYNCLKYSLKEHEII